MRGLKQLFLAIAAYAVFGSVGAAAQEVRAVEYDSRGAIRFKSYDTIPAETRLVITDGDGLNGIIKDVAGDDDKLNDRPDFAHVVEYGEKKVCKTEEECDFLFGENLGNVYRQERDAFISRHVEIYKAIVSGRMNGKVTVWQSPRLSLDYGGELVLFNGAVNVRAVAEDGTEYRVISCEKGSTGYFSVKKKNRGRRIIRMVNDDSEPAKKLVGDLVGYALRFHSIGKKNK